MREFLDTPSQEGPEAGPDVGQHPLPEPTQQRGRKDHLRGDQPTWTFRDTAIGTLLTLVPWLGLATLALLQAPEQSAPRQPLAPGIDIANAIITFIIQTVLEAVFLIAPLWFAVFKPRRLARARGQPDPRLRTGFEALGFRKFRIWQALAALVLGMLTIFLASIAYSAIVQALHLPLQTNADVLAERAAAEPWTTVATLLAAVIIAPFCEEVFFRGFLFQGLRLRINVWAAVVLSTVLFALAHGDLGSLTLLLVIGLLLAILRWKTRSLWPGIVLHMLNNGLAALVILQAIAAR